MMLLSIVVPCYNEAAALPHLYEALKQVGDELKSRVNLELILVNDGSRDETLQLMRQLHQDDPRVQ